MCVRVRDCVCMCVCVYMRMCVFACVRACVRTCVRVGGCECVRGRALAHVRSCVCVNAYTSSRFYKAAQTVGNLQTS